MFRSPVPTASWLAALLREEKGSAIIQFAMVAPALIALLLAALQTSLVFFAQEALETSVEAAARSIITGQAQASDANGGANGMTQAQLQARFKQNACNSMPRFLSCAKLMVDVQSSTDWSSINTSRPTLTFDANGNVTNSFSYNLGNSGSIAVVRLIYLWPVLTGPLGFNLSDAAPNKRLIVATAVAKVENYSAS